MLVSASAHMIGTHECKGMVSADTCRTSCDPLQCIARGLTPFVGSMFGLNPAPEEALWVFSWRPFLLWFVFGVYRSKTTTLSSSLSFDSMASIHLQAPLAARVAQVASLARAVSNACFLLDNNALCMSCGAGAAARWICAGQPWCVHLPLVSKLAARGCIAATPRLCCGGVPRAFWRFGTRGLKGASSAGV